MKPASQPSEFNKSKSNSNAWTKREKLSSAITKYLWSYAHGQQYTSKFGESDQVCA